jgi:hypothetical protein
VGGGMQREREKGKGKGKGMVKKKGGRRKR